MHKDENARLDYLEEQIKELEEGNIGKEDWLMERRDELKEMYNRGEELALYLDDLTASYPDGFPEDLYQEFFWRRRGISGLDGEVRGIVYRI